MKIMPISQKNGSNFKRDYKTKLVSVERHPDYEARTYETEASTGKKWGVGIASFFITGLGQAINDQWGKAAGFFFGYGALVTLTYILTIASAIRGKNLAAGMVTGLGALGLDIWSIVDAVKNAKSESTQIIPIKSDEYRKSFDTNA